MGSQGLYAQLDATQHAVSMDALTHNHEFDILRAIKIKSNLLSLYPSMGAERSTLPYSLEECKL